MPIKPRKKLIDQVKLRLPLPKKEPRPMMDKVAERMRLLCQDFYLVTKDLQALLLADEIVSIERSEIAARRKALLVKLAKIESDILDLSTLVGWHKFLDQVDQLAEQDQKPKPDGKE